MKTSCDGSAMIYDPEHCHNCAEFKSGHQCPGCRRCLWKTQRQQFMLLLKHKLSRKKKTIYWFNWPKSFRDIIGYYRRTRG